MSPLQQSFIKLIVTLGGVMLGLMILSTTLAN